MSNQPIIFNLRYTPYKPPKGATAEERNKHARERAFYNMTGEYTIYDYMSNEDKVKGDGRDPPEYITKTVTDERLFTFFEYLQKSTKVFNKNGTISPEELQAMKERAKKNTGNIWHGYISLNQEESHKIDTPEKCILLVKNTFGTFFKEAKLEEENIDLMCSLHKDRPHHLHVHFTFWEKEPKYKNTNGEMEYRRKGKLPMAAIDNMFVKAGIWVSDGKDRLYRSRDNANAELRKLTRASVLRQKSETLQNAILRLAADLPDTGRLSYASKDMEPYRKRVDEIVDMLIQSDATARRADFEFRKELAIRKQVIKNICNQPQAFSDSDITPEAMAADLPTYHYTIDDHNIHIVTDIEEDYKRRMGNSVLKLAKGIKPELFRRPTISNRASDNLMKYRIRSSNRKTGRILKNFLGQFGQDAAGSAMNARDRLREIEEEIEREQSEQNQSAKRRYGGYE